MKRFSILNSYKIKYVLVFISFLSSFSSIANKAKTEIDTKGTIVTKDSKKGLFSIQFSWNADSYSKDISIEVEYKKKSLLSKAKTSGKDAFLASKNQFINIELSDGDYELIAVRLKGIEIGYGKYLKIPLEGTFTIKAGAVTNGGLVYLIRKNKESHKIMTLKINNNEDVKRYIKAYQPTFTNQIESIQPAWKFIANEKVDKLVKSFAQVLVDNESRGQRPKVTYLYGTLGLVIKMKKNAEGKVTNHELIRTPTYQQIRIMTLRKDKKIICSLENGSFLYGDDKGLDYIPLPKSLEKTAELHELDNNQFLMLDRNLNIFTADETFKWKEHLKNRTNYKSSFFQANLTKIKVYKGKKHLYIFSNGIGKSKILLQSPYNNFNFNEVALSSDIKKVPMVTETETQLIIGPVLKVNSSAKRPALIYVKNLQGDTWKEYNLPFGDCYGFAPDRQDDTIFFTKCRKSDWHKSIDSGKTWEKYVTSK
jgi:hypothetical protein